MASQSLFGTSQNRSINPKKLTPYFYILPATLFLTAIMGYPIVYSIFMSFQKYTLTELVSKHPVFNGFQNYQAVLNNPQFLIALKHSLIFTFVSILFQFLIGLGLAILFSKSFPMSNIMRGFLLSGWQIPSVVTGTIFVWMFNGDYGLVNFLLTSLNIVKEPIGWLTTGNFALTSVILVNIWLGIPFNTILLTAGITGLPEDVFEAATVDGANYWQKMIYLTIPLLKSTIFAVLMLGFIYTLRVFDVIWIMTKGGPGSATEVLPTFAYRLSFISFNFGQSAAVSVIILFILMIAAAFYLKFAILVEN